VKVLLIDPSLYTPPYDGALADALGRRGHDVTLLARRPRPTDPPVGPNVRVEPMFYRDGEWLGSRAVLRQVTKGLEHVSDLSRLRWLVREWRPDVVHWQWPSLPLIDAQALRVLRRYAPQVVTVHDGRVFKSKTGLRRLMGFGWGRFVNGADAVIAHVEATRESLTRLGVPGERISIVPHPVFPRPRCTAHGDAREPRVAGHPLRALYFGRLSDDKGIDVLAAALERLGPEVRLHVEVCGPVIGEDLRVHAAVERLSRLANATLETRFVPEDELDRRLRGTDLVVLPHREVDASGVLMKALGYDVGIVASDVRAFREVLQGTDGARLFRSDDAGDLARVLAELAARPEQAARMRAAVAQLRTHALSWSRAAELTESVYARVLTRRADAPAMGAA
jgi:glycosyltransferase involved in cell wall biosynthesis